jgi:hypothetical protein
LASRGGNCGGFVGIHGGAGGEGVHRWVGFLSPPEYDFWGGAGVEISSVPLVGGPCKRNMRMRRTRRASVQTHFHPKFGPGMRLADNPISLHRATGLGVYLNFNRVNANVHFTQYSLVEDIVWSLLGFLFR